MATPYRTGPALLQVDLPVGYHAELEDELEPGEEVVWTGVPLRERLRRRALGELGLPLLWNGFVLFLVWAASGHGSAVWLGAVPLLAIGMPLFLGPLDAWRAADNTFYALTDRRVLFFDGDHVFAYPRSRVRPRVRGERADGIGDVAFELARDRGGRGGLAAFVGIKGARRVAELLRTR